MKSQEARPRIRHFQVWIILAAGFVFLACEHPSARQDKSGIAISFDDHFIDEWYALRPIFQRYHAKVTFFVTCGDSLSQDEILKLKTLQLDGHEIGFHGTIHGKATELIAALGPEKYAATELAPGLGYMKVAGIMPTAYAHPGGDHNGQVDSVLLANGFTTLRDVAMSRRKIFGIQLYAIPPRLMRWIYYPFDQSQQVDALLIDTGAGLDPEEMKEALEKTRVTNTALLLFGHQPLYKPAKKGQYGFDVAFLETILREAQHRKLRFYTMSELPH